jgi:hypothetical protein
MSMNSVGSVMWRLVPIWVFGLLLGMTGSGQAKVERKQILPIPNYEQ